jgi:hypothetical protein
LEAFGNPSGTEVSIKPGQPFFCHLAILRLFCPNRISFLSIALAQPNKNR